MNNRTWRQNESTVGRPLCVIKILAGMSVAVFLGVNEWLT